MRAPPSWARPRVSADAHHAPARPAGTRARTAGARGNAASQEFLFPIALALASPGSLRARDRHAGCGSGGLADGDHRTADPLAGWPAPGSRAAARSCAKNRRTFPSRPKFRCSAGERRRVLPRGGRGIGRGRECTELGTPGSQKPGARPSKSKARCCKAVGRLRSSNAGAPGALGWMRLRVSVARCSSSVAKLCAGNSS
jgi:hypothetical protein